MYIQKLQLKNFRCFINTEFFLNHPGPTDGPKVNGRLPSLKNVNLFLGPNGSGKSSVFQAAALGVLSPIVRSAQIPPAYLVRRTSGVETAGAGDTSDDRATVQATVRLQEVDWTYAELMDPPIGQVVILRKGDIEELEHINTAHTNPLLWEALYQNDHPGFFMVGYGASRRTERPEGYSEGSRTPRYQRVAGLFEDHVGLVPFNYAALQLSSYGRDNAARDLLNRLLPQDVQLTPNFDSQSNPLFQVKGVALPFPALSDGFRAFVGWVWDMLYQLSRVGKNVNLLTDIPGCVIVDEIDLFLHPEWQRCVVEQIATTFPRLQFLFSTHSPLVAGSLEAGNIYSLDTDDQGAAVVRQYEENIYGLSASQVLTSSYFGLHSTRAPHTGTLDDLAERALNGDATAETEFLHQMRQGIDIE